MSVEHSIDRISPEFIREKMPREDIFASHRIRQRIPFFRNPAKIWQETLENLRQTVYGKNYETVRPEDRERLLAAQVEISEWLKGQVAPEDYQPNNPFYVKEQLGKNAPILKHRSGFFNRSVSSDTSPYGYSIKCVDDWPDDLNVDGLAKNFDSFSIFRISDSESLRYTVHPDNSYDLQINFYGMDNGQHGARHDKYEPPTLPLSQMPQKECELLLAELQSIIAAEDILVTPAVLVKIRSKTASWVHEDKLYTGEEKSVRTIQSLPETKEQREARIKNEEVEALERYKQWKRKVGWKPHV